MADDASWNPAGMRDLNRVPVGQETAQELRRLISEAERMRSVQSSRIAVDHLGYATEAIGAFTHKNRTYGILLQNTRAEGGEGWILRVVSPEELAR